MFRLTAAITTQNRNIYSPLAGAAVATGRGPWYRQRVPLRLFHHLGKALYDHQ